MKLLMNTVCVVAFILLVGKTSAQKEDFEPIRDECLKLHDVTMDELEAMNPGEPKDEAAVDQKFKCFSHCMVDKMGYLDDTGKVDIEKLRADDSVSDSNLDAIEACKGEHDMIEDPCEYTFKMMTCAMGAMTK